MLTAETILFGGNINAPVKTRLAKAVGVSDMTISRWSKSADSIPLSKLRALCRIRGLSDRQMLDILKG